MLQMLKRMKNSMGYIMVIVALLFIQAYCDLSLPAYTSNIVDVGIQQKGIEDAIPETLREESLQKLSFLVNDTEKTTLLAAYKQEKDGLYHLDKKNTSIEALNEMLPIPMMILLQAEQQDGMHGELPMGNVTPDALLKIQEMILQAKKAAEQMPENIISQAAISYVQQEYEAQGKDIDAIQMKYLLAAGVRMLGMTLLIMLCSIGVAFLSCRVAASLGRDLRNQVYRKVISFSNGEMDKFSTASLITRSTNDIQQVQMLFMMIFRIVLYAPIIGVGSVLKVLRTESSMTWILALGVSLIGMLVLVLMLIAMPKFNKLQILVDKLNLVTREILTGIPVIRAFSREKHEEERFEDANKRLTKMTLFVNRVMTFMMPCMMLIMNGITVLIIYVGAHGIDDGKIQVGAMMAFMQYTMQVIMSFLMITMISIMLPRAEVSAKRINEVLNTRQSIHNLSAPKKPSEELKGQVEFRDVSFCYPGAEEKVLEGISFIAKKGETVAFIGSTGSGKSTLVNLIPRLFDVSGGAVLVDGIDVREMEISDLRARLGIVPQKGILFSGSIASNLRFGKADASLEELEGAARIAQAAEFIEQKEEKYDDPIAQGGSNVSGGQKQRLSIARAIVKQPEIFIFDDSFSALDFKTDLALRQALKRETGDATTLIVAQRISTIMQADKILVLDEGKIAGMGTHKELLESCEIYRQIAKSQLSEEELSA